MHISCQPQLLPTAPSLQATQEPRRAIVPVHPRVKYCTVLIQPAQDELSFVPVTLGMLCLQGLGMQTLCAALLCFSGMTFGYLEHWEFVTQEEEIIKLTSSWFNTLILKLK